MSSHHSHAVDPASGVLLRFAEQCWMVIQALAPWLLLGAIVAGVLHVVLPPGFVRRYLRGRFGVLRAVMLGVPLPLCSCGVIPAGLGLRRDGASRGASIGFLIATPQTGVDSLLVSGAFLGWPLAVFKLVSAFILGLVGGTLAGNDEADEHSAPPPDAGASRPSLRQGLDHSLELISSIWRWLFVGVLVSAALGTFIPPDAFATFADNQLLALVAALAISIPLYVCATASIPIAAALVAGGFPLGAALVFLIAGPATNVATIGAVRQNFGRRALWAYLGTMIIGTLFFGAFFDWVLAGSGAVAGPGAMDHDGPLGFGAGLVLSAMLLYFAGRELIEWIGRRRPVEETVSIQVEGLTCNGCVRKLESALGAVEGVEGCQVNLGEAGSRQGVALVSGPAARAALVDAVKQAGFEPR